jgi:fluoroquinolone resistance protein
MEYFEDLTFKKKDYTKKALTNGLYEQCNFEHCDFSKSDLNDCNFTDCTFSHCNLSLANVTNTKFNGCSFKDCKMIGIQFQLCSHFGLTLSFYSCNLSDSQFSNLPLEGTTFSKCNLQFVDFTATKLENSIMIECDMHDAIFFNTNVVKVNFTGSYGLIINPESNSILKATFSSDSLSGLLTKYKLTIV